MKLEITHLKQFHKIPGIPEYDQYKPICNKIAKHQYELAKYLTQNPNIPVIVESLYDNIDCINSSDMCNVTKNFIFPQGLPDNFNQLTFLQKKFLYEEGAATTLVYMGILPIVYKSIDKEFSDKIDAEAEQLSYEELYQKVTTDDDFGNRENFALDNAALVAEAVYGISNENKIFIIFGGAHDFKNECNDRGFELKEVSFSGDIIINYDGTY